MHIVSYFEFKSNHHLGNNLGIPNQQLPPLWSFPKPFISNTSMKQTQADVKLL